MFLYFYKMENYGIVILIMGIMIAASGMADRVRLPTPVFLTGIGIAVGFIPSMPPVELDPSIVMLIFLPPLLYDAAFNISYEEFRANMIVPLDPASEAVPEHLTLARGRRRESA